ncbi:MULTISPECIES: Abi family protein [Microbacteriaceae]|uniref:Abi family protein n=1 Tax=Microbacteriaceae TaxID=85023 RepID=UPI001414DB8E|nr:MULTISPECIES: Abi family protein [Microbacteriaceae]
MTSQPALQRLLGTARLATYLTAAKGDLNRAADLYLWVTQVSGALHGQISFVEIAVRNAIDAQLAIWNTARGFGADWTAAQGTADPLYTLLRKQLEDARGRADVEARERGSNHRRHGVAATHDDVVAQLMFGSWVKVIRPVSRTESPARQQRLWAAGVSLAFPHASSDDMSRIAIGDQLDTLRRLRNRVAHHDNLLEVALKHRLNGMLSLLAKLDPAYPQLAAARSTLRQLIKDDPRRAW